MNDRAFGNTEFSKDIVYIGVNDKDIDLFESQYIVPNGVSYNSYVIMDEKIAIMDTVDDRKTDQWVENLQEALGGRTPDYLVVQHVEPDHAGSVAKALALYPEITVVGNAKTIPMLQQFFDELEIKNSLVVKEGDTLSLGGHTLTFLMAPMVHWPEVMVTYESTEKVLFSADGFGKFGALDTEEDWACEARRYYFNIVGKYGAPVQALLKKAAAVEIQTIAPLHGPVLTENLEFYLNLYNTWSSYSVETKGVFIAVASIHGNTMKAAETLADILRAKGEERVVVADLAREDMAECVEDAFRYGKIVLATTTYNADIFPFMRTFIDHLTERKFQNKTVGFIENGTWAPTAKKVMAEMLSKSKNITFVPTTVTIKSALNADSKAAIAQLAEELL